MEEKKTTEVSSTASSNLFALECLATTAGQLHESEKLKQCLSNSNTATAQTASKERKDKEEEKSNRVPVVQMAPMSSMENPNSLLPPMTFNNFYSPFTQPTSTIRPFTDFTLPPPFSHASFRNFMDLPMPPTTSFGIKMEDMPWNRSGLPPVIPSSHENNEKNISSDTAKSAFDIVPKRHNGLSSPHSNNGFDVPHPPYKPSDVVMNNAGNIPQQPPVLFRIDQPNNSSLLETLVQESQKILSSQEEQANQETPANMFSDLKNENPRKETDQASKTNDDFKRAREMVLISPQKKTSRKRNGLHPASDVKRAYGGPPFKPGYAPPSVNTSESAMCCLYEHTLLKMATRGFWSGDRGPLQDVFRLTRVENSDLQYNMKAITKHCYSVVKRKLDHAEEDKEMMHKHMRNYVDEFDSYLDRIYPVSSIAINLYLPTAADYSVATWHGIVPTGWSEYRRAVIIREVFEVLFHLSSSVDTIPEYNSKFFDKPESDKSLLPIPLDTYNKKKKKNASEKSSAENGTKDQNNNNDDNNDETSMDTEQLNTSDVKYSRAFEALWTRTSPHEPYLILQDLSQVKLREYFESYPIEVYAPKEETLIVVDEKKYKARNILGFFRRGVQLVDYSKETGSMVIDTISTLRNVSATSAVRKIPPGRISKLVHPDLHLENYTNAILQVDSNGLESDGVQSVTARPPKVRRRRGKNRNSGEAKEEKVKKRRTKAPSVVEQTPTPSTAHEQFMSQQLAPPPPMVEKLDSIESICNSMKMEGVDEKVFTSPTSQHFPSFPRPASDDSLKALGAEQITPLRTAHIDMHHSVESMLPKETNNELLDKNFEKLNDSYLVNQQTQTFHDSSTLNSKADIITPNLFSPDILSPMCNIQQQQRQQQKYPQPPFNFGGCPPGPPDQQQFSLHLMIDSYRRAAKYLLDTANHLELVARHGNHGNTNNGNATTDKDVSKKEKSDK